MNKHVSKMYSVTSSERAKKTDEAEMMATQNKNKIDHIRTLFKGKEDTKVKKIGEHETSAYKRQFAFGEEAQQMVKTDIQEHNFKQDAFTIYTNEFVKFKHALRLK